MPRVAEGEVLNESFDEQEFSNKNTILQEIEKFWTLSPIFQRKMVRNLPLILEKITDENLLLCVKKLFVDDQNVILDNFEVCGEMIQQTKMLLTYCKTLEAHAEVQSRQLEVQKILVKFLENAITSQKRTLVFKAKNVIVECKELFLSAVYDE